MVRLAGVCSWGFLSLLNSIIIPRQDHQLYPRRWFLAPIVGKVLKVKGFYGFPFVIIFQGTYCCAGCYRIIKKRSPEFRARDVIGCGE
jgi:hypothetical protein